MKREWRGISSVDKTCSGRAQVMGWTKENLGKVPGSFPKAMWFT